MRRCVAALVIATLFVAGCVQVAPAAPTTGLPASPATAATTPRPSIPSAPASATETFLPVPPPAHDAGEGSIAYILDSNLWLAAPDGSGARPLTSDGAALAYHHPSQAPDGSIYVLRGTNTLVHLDRAGGPVSEPLTLATLENGAESLSVSPDGRHIAYTTTGYGTEIDPRFGTPTGTFLYGGTDVATPDGTSVSDAALANMLFPSWVDADTLLFADGVSVYTADIGSDPQPWIDTSEGCITEFDCPSGALVSASLSAPAISTTGNVVTYASQPYFGDEGRVFAPLSGTPPAAPGEGCLAVDQAAHTDPGTFSPDGRRFAFDDTYFDRDEFDTFTGEGLFTMTVDITAQDCGASSARLLIAGGSQPDWAPFAP